VIDGTPIGGARELSRYDRAGGLGRDPARRRINVGGLARRVLAGLRRRVG